MFLRKIDFVFRFGVAGVRGKLKFVNHENALHRRYRRIVTRSPLNMKFLRQSC